MRNRKQYFREFWALKDVSLEIKKGETVGIVGRNGSGKSTLLQLICGTLNPTSGNISTHGKIAALLELGSGFNPQFTGRENVYLNGTILGLKTAEINDRFADIASFAEIGNFIDQPVKTYSSGMMMRLAFAVAIHVEPEILIIDEALSVGDELFQRKCFSRIEAIRASGATIVFVSHSGATIVNLCNRAVLIDMGEKLAVGAPKQIVGVYQKMLYSPADKRMQFREEIRRLDNQTDSTVAVIGNSKSTETASKPPEPKFTESFAPNLIPSSTIEYESKGAVIESPKILTLDGKQVNILIRNKTYHYSYCVRFSKSIPKIRFGMLIKTTSGLELGGSATATDLQGHLERAENGAVYNVQFEFRCALNQGTFFINAGVMGEVDGEETYIHRLIDAVAFRVMPDKENLATGIVDFICAQEVKLLQN